MSWKKFNLYGGLSLAMCFWAFSFIWYKIAFQYFEPMALVFFRLIAASIFVSLLIVLFGKFERIRKKHYRIFLLLVFFEPFLYFIGESYGMQIVTSTTGAVIISFIPLLTPVAAYFIYKNRLTWYNFAGILVSFVGVLFVLTGRDFVLIAPIKGIILMFLAVISAIIYSAIIVYLAKHYKPITIVWIQSVAGAIFFLPLFTIFDLEETMMVNWSWEVLAPIIKLGIFPSALSFILFNRAIREIGMTIPNIYTNFIPVFTAILSFIILKEDMPPGKIIGIFIVLTGLWISQRKANLHRSLKH